MAEKLRDSVTALVGLPGTKWLVLKSQAKMHLSSSGINSHVSKGESIVPVEMKAEKPWSLVCIMYTGLLTIERFGRRSLIHRAS